MAHARIIQQQMLDWIGNSIALRSALPTDAQIVDRFNLPGVESARSLLADLADAGEITIKGFGATRTIAIGRKPRAFDAAARPTPPVVARVGSKRADDDEAQLDIATARIRDIIARGKKPAVATTPVAEPVAQADTVNAEDVRGAPIAPIVEVQPQPEPEPEIVMPEAVPLSEIEQSPPPVIAAPSRQETAVATRDARRQLNIHFPHDHFDKLTEMANREGSSAAAFARATLISCLDRKPRVPAAVTAAALREKAPVVDFAHRMMTLGLAAYDHERTGGAAK